MIEKNNFVSNIITNYTISKDVYTDLLFQHGVEKVYFYGDESTYNRNTDFVHYLPKKNENFGLHRGNNDIIDPINMIDIGCDYNAHIDLNYCQFVNNLKRKYNEITSDFERKVISRVIGLFEPYQKIEIPVLNVSAIRTEVISKNMKSKINELNELIKSIKRNDSYQKYQKSIFELGLIDKITDIERQSGKIKDVLEEVISYATSLSRTLGTLLKVTETFGYILIDKKREQKEFNPLILNLDHLHKEASLSALDRILIR